MQATIISNALQTQDHQRYEHPSPQVVIIRGRSSTISISLPLLQQYFINMERRNQDYAYFQFVYADIPQRQSPKTIGLSDPIQIGVTCKLRLYDQPTQVSSTCSFDFDIQLQLSSRQFNCEEIAALVRNQFKLAAAQTFTDAVLQRQRDVFFANLYDFSFDTSTGKFVASFQPQLSYRYFNTDTSIANQNVEVVSLQFEFGPASTTSYTSYQNRYLASLFGGTYNETTQLWSSIFSFEQSDFDTLQPGTACMFYSLIQARDSSTSTYKLYHIYDTVNAYCSNIPRLSVDDYVYIKGSPQSSVWTSTGQSLDLVAAITRNKGYGQTLSGSQAYLTQQTQPVKTTLSSMRQMIFQLVDKYEQPLEFEEDYVLKLAVIFDID